MFNINNPISIFINQENDYKKNHETFLEQLKILYEDFKKRNESKNKKWENKQDPKNFLINIESQIYQSPITLVHSKWGQGKTYFFEELIYNCFCEKDNQKIDIKEKYKFEKILMIDLWKYINNDDFVNDIVFEIYNFLLPNSKKFKNVFLKIIKSIIKITGILNLKSAGMSFLDCLSKSNFNSSYELSNSKRKSIENINKDLKNIKRTIIIFDNLERLENNIVFAFKLIQKISMINNLLIILPMDKDKLKIANINSNNIDTWLEKYITLGNYFVFDQDYKDFLSTKINDKNKKYIDLINKILLNKKDNIRKIENKINFDNVNLTFNISECHGIEYLCKVCGIENSTAFYKNKIKKIIDILYCINKNYHSLELALDNYPYYNNYDHSLFNVNLNDNDFCKRLSELKNTIFPENFIFGDDEIPRWDFSINKKNFINIEINSINNLLKEYKKPSITYKPLITYKQINNLLYFNKEEKLNEEENNLNEEINNRNKEIIDLINKIKTKRKKLISLLKEPEMNKIYDALLSFREFILKNNGDEFKNRAIKLDDFLLYFSNKIENEINNKLKNTIL